MSSVESHYHPIGTKTNQSHVHFAELPPIKYENFACNIHYEDAIYLGPSLQNLVKHLTATFPGIKMNLEKNDGLTDIFFVQVRDSDGNQIFKEEWLSNELINHETKITEEIEHMITHCFLDLKHDLEASSGKVKQ